MLSGNALKKSAETFEQLDRELIRIECEEDGLFFTRYFFKIRQAMKFRMNWHHVIISDYLEMVTQGLIKNLVINVSPGSSKTELAVINFIARNIARNPWARFLHLSGSDMLASQNSAAARDIVTSDEFQRLWPMKIRDDSNSKKRWNVEVKGRQAGGVYATALGGQVIGFRAGHMTSGFQGAIVIDDPIKPEDIYSKPKLEQKNRMLLSTVDSRRANPDVPVVLIMQRLGSSDPTDFIEKGNLPGEWEYLKIPAILDKPYRRSLAPRYREMIDRSDQKDGRMSYWPYKEPLPRLLQMEAGAGADQAGGRVSRHVFSAQYQQSPQVLGGNIIKGKDFVRYKILPKIIYRKVFVDTAQKTKERNDWSVFEEWGVGGDGRIYLLDMIRGRWESPELKKRAIAFWSKRIVTSGIGQLREMPVEDKNSGTDLIQTLKLPPPDGANIPIKAIQRHTDKLTRLMDGLPYIEAGQVCIPEDAPFTSDFVAECEAVTADDTHDFDDQIDAMLDAIADMLSNQNKLKVWAKVSDKTKGTENNAAARGFIA